MWLKLLFNGNQVLVLQFATLQGNANLFSIYFLCIGICKLNQSYLVDIDSSMHNTLYTWTFPGDEKVP